MFEAATSDALARLAARGLGVGLLPGPDPHPGLRALTLADPRARARAAQLGDRALAVSYPDEVGLTLGLDIDMVLQQTPIDWTQHHGGELLV